MKLKLISSSLCLSILTVFLSGINLQLQAEPLIPDEVIENQNWRNRLYDEDYEATPSPFNPDWKRLTLVHTLTKHLSPVFNLTFNNQGNILVSAGSYNDPVLRYWAIGSGEQIYSDRGHASTVTSLHYSPDGSTLVSTGQGAGVNIWDGYSRKYEATFLMHANNILASAITPDSGTLVTGGLDGIRVWNLKYRRPTYTLSGVGNPSYALAIHPNGYILASGDGEGNVTLWNLRTAKQISQFKPHEKEINGLIFTPDGTQLITSSAGKTVKIWDIASGNLVREFVGHKDRLRVITLSPDGKTLASGGNDGARIWDMNTGEMLALVPSTNDWVESLAFSPDSTMLAIGSFSSEIQLWQAKVGESVATTEETE